VTASEETLDLLSRVNKALSAEYSARAALAAGKEAELREELAALTAVRAIELADAEALRNRVAGQASLEAQLLADAEALRDQAARQASLEAQLLAASDRASGLSDELDHLREAALQMSNRAEADRRQSELGLADAHAELSRLRVHVSDLEVQAEHFKGTIGDLQQKLHKADSEILKERDAQSRLEGRLEIATARLEATEASERTAYEQIAALTTQARTYENELELSRATHSRAKERARMLLKAVSADLEAAHQAAAHAERREQSLLLKLEHLEAAQVANGQLEQRVRLLEEGSAQSVAIPAERADSSLTSDGSQICAEGSVRTVEEPAAEILAQAGLLKQGIDDALREEAAMTVSSLDDMLEYHDEAFVRIAYFVLLRRQVDPTGLGHYTKFLRQGGDRLQVLADLSKSAEARLANVEVQGLKPALRWHRLKRFLLPSRLFGLSANGNRQAGLRAIENHLIRIEAQIAGLRTAGGNAGAVGAPGVERAVLAIAAPAQQTSSRTPEFQIPELAAAPEQTAAIPSEVSLDENFSLPTEQWQRISDRLFDRLWPKWTGERPGLVTAAERRLVVVVSGDGNMKSPAARHESLADLRSKATFDVAFFELGTGSKPSKSADKSHRNLADLGEMLLPSDLVLFIESGDEVDSKLAIALELESAWDRDFLLFDQMFGDGDRSRLVAFHGVDARHHAYCDYFSSRFVASGRAIINALPHAASVSELARGILDTVGHDPRRVLHLSFPFLKISGLSNDLITQRRVELMHALSKSHVTAGREFDHSVSVIICTKNGGYLLNALVSQLLAMKQIGEIIIVSNNTSGDYTIGVLDELSRDERCKILIFNKPFSFSEQCNLGARASTCDHLLFMNDDIGPIGTDWLDYLLGDIASHPNRIVGPLLLYPDQSAQHAGMYLGFNNCAGHAYRYLHHPHGASMFELVAPRRVSCLTAACMLMKREVFEALNGFDQMLAHTFQDVDLSLRALFSGVELLFDPRAILFHFESVTVKPTLLEEATMQLRGREHAYFFARWGSELHKDAWHNRSLSSQDESLRTIKVSN
jgi:GT2 family glycosyltransferase